MSGLGLESGLRLGSLAQGVEFFTKGWVFEPAAEGALGYAGVFGGLGQGLGEGNPGEGGLLAEGEFGNFDFPAISGHFGPLYLTVGGGCSVRVGFGIGVALGEPGAGSLLLVFRHQTSRGLSGFVVLVGVTWERWAMCL